MHVPPPSSLLVLTASALALSCGARAELIEAGARGSSFGDSPLANAAPSLDDEADPPVRNPTGGGPEETPPDNAAPPQAEAPPGVEAPPPPPPPVAEPEPPPPTEPGLAMASDPILDEAASVCSDALTLGEAIAITFDIYPELGAPGPLLSDLPPGMPGIVARSLDRDYPLVLVVQTLAAGSAIYSYVFFDEACFPVIGLQDRLTRDAEGCWQGHITSLLGVPGDFDRCKQPLENLTAVFSGEYMTDCGGSESAGGYEAAFTLKGLSSEAGTLTFQDTPNLRINGLELAVVDPGQPLSAERVEESQTGDCVATQEVTALLSVDAQFLQITERLVNTCADGSQAACSWNSFGKRIEVVSGPSAN